MTLRIARKYLLLAGILALAAIALAAWGLQQRAAAAVTDDRVAAGAAEPANQVDGAAYAVIEVTGTGVATGRPDLATVALRVSVTSDPVTAARAQAAAATRSVLDALEDNGVAYADIRTDRFTIQPAYDWSDGEQTFVGYTVDNGLAATVRDLAKLGAIIDDAVTAGGEYIRFDYVSFGFADTAGLERRARQAAVADMRQKAAQLAEFAGRELGELKSLAEVDDGGYPGPYSETLLSRAEAAYADLGTPVAPGEDTVAVTVYGVYELR